ncbi:hypothetical protein GGI21_004127 [Coemansia aciculifera]|nr:hypothetical protein GGI21_004127 [Coemansia aciculifera]
MANIGGFGGGNVLAAGYSSGGGGGGGNIGATHSVTNFASYNSNQMNQPGSQFMTQQQQQQQRLMQPNSAMTFGGNQSSMNQIGNKYDLFKSVNPHAPSIFNGNMQPQQQQQMPGAQNVQYSSSSIVTSSGFNLNGNPSLQSSNIGQRPAGPSGVFAMANPTLGNQQQQQNMLQAQMLNQQQQQQSQPQQQQIFGNNNSAAGFGSQMQWH